MKILRLFSYLLTGAIGVTLAGWVIALTPFSIRLGIYSIVLFLLFIVASLTFDDPIAEYLGIELPAYYAIIGGVAISFISGLAVLGGILL